MQTSSDIWTLFDNHSCQHWKTVKSVVLLIQWVYKGIFFLLIMCIFLIINMNSFHVEIHLLFLSTSSSHGYSELIGILSYILDKNPLLVTCVAIIFYHFEPCCLTAFLVSLDKKFYICQIYQYFLQLIFCSLTCFPSTKFLAFHFKKKFSGFVF